MHLTVLKRVDKLPLATRLLGENPALLPPPVSRWSPRSLEKVAQKTLRLYRKFKFEMAADKIPSYGWRSELAFCLLLISRFVTTCGEIADKAESLLLSVRFYLT